MLRRIYRINFLYKAGSVIQLDFSNRRPFMHKGTFQFPHLVSYFRFFAAFFSERFWSPAQSAELFLQFFAQCNLLGKHLYLIILQILALFLTIFRPLMIKIQLSVNGFLRDISFRQLVDFCRQFRYLIQNLVILHPYRLRLSVLLYPVLTPLVNLV